MNLDTFFTEHGWDVIDTITIPAREGKYYEYTDIGLSSYSVMLSEIISSSQGIYLHQKEAIKHVLSGQNVCIFTGTASGKSLVFHISAIEKILEDTDTKVLAIYPLKALGQEQHKRWTNAFKSAGLNIVAGRIDGQTPMSERLNILRKSQVIIMTPDVIHAWLMYNLNEKAIANFLSRVSLIIVDEVHNYTGVFGSNAAFLFRRMQHVMSLLGNRPQYIAASATISDPVNHLRKLFGVDFHLIDQSLDSSPQCKITLKFIDSIKTKDMLTSISDLLEFITKNTEHKFIAFVDSRKQAEYIAAITSRMQLKDDDLNFNYNHLQSLSILPYRAGYEEHDRNLIQERLSQGSLTGIVSTSALELGIDIPFLTLCILVGVPHSSTSFYQRIGRVGRQRDGVVIVINTGDIFSEDIFKEPKKILNMPLSESALYLENQRIQYIHALCLARHGGEHDQICSYLKKNENDNFENLIDWPNEFIELCKAERVGVIAPELQAMKAQAGDDPNHTFPLRDVDVQFKVEYKRGPDRRQMGSLSYSQLLREAYPGAVYYYTSKPYRVYRVRTGSRVVEVRTEKRYATKPIFLPAMVFPNLNTENIYNGYRYDDLIVVECDLQIREAVAGYKERRGPNETNLDYPLRPDSGLYFNLSRFTRNFFTTGVVITHPSLNNNMVQCDVIANLFFEAFLMQLAFERRDLSFANDKFRLEYGNIKKNEKFICIYDQTYGSLRLSGRLMDHDMLSTIWRKVLEISERRDYTALNEKTLETINELHKCSNLSYSNYNTDLTDYMEDSSETLIKIILPNSKGININKNNEEFFVEACFFSPKHNELMYRGKHLSQKIKQHEDAIITVPVNSIIEIPGESDVGLYNIETGEILHSPSHEDTLI